jgi:hypothetical protein
MNKLLIFTKKNIRASFAYNMNKIRIREDLKFILNNNLFNFTLCCELNLISRIKLS